MTNNSTHPERAGVIQHLEGIIETLEAEQFEHPTHRRGELIIDFRVELMELKLGEATK